MSAVLEMLPPAARACVKCKRVLPLDSFYKDRRIADGRQARCKECFNRAIAARRADTRKRNRERREKARAWAIQRELRSGNSELPKGPRVVRKAVAKCICGAPQYAHLNSKGRTSAGCPYFHEAGT